MSLTYRQIQPQQLNLIEPLWDKLRLIHLEDSKNFKEHFVKLTFEERCKEFYQMSPYNIRITIVEDKEREIIAYSIATINQEKKNGKIESIFVGSDIRKNGIGTNLMEDMIFWMEKNNCSNLELSVVAGHEKVFKFYEKFGFYPRVTYMSRKKYND